MWKKVPVRAFFLFYFTAMRTPYLLFLCMLCCMLHCNAQNIAIDYPPYSKRNTEAIEITRIVRNDTATILHMEAYNLPGYWVRLSSGLCLHGSESGTDYPVVSSQGFELGKEVYMPRSGNISFSLRFPPLLPEERHIDFMENAGDGSFQITGINLKPQRESRNVHCRLSGTVPHSPQSSRLVLIPAGGDTRSASWLSIPVKNGKFEYDLYTDCEEAYEIFIWNDMVNGSWRPVTFFAENGPVNFTLHPVTNDSLGNHIETQNPLTKEWLRLTVESRTIFSLEECQRQREALEKENNFFSKAYLNTRKEISKAAEHNDLPKLDSLIQQSERLKKEGKAYTEAAKALLEKVNRIKREREAWMLSQVKENPTIAGLYLLKQRIMSRDTLHVSSYKEAFQSVYAKRFPRHPYSQQIAQFLHEGQMVPGRPFIDFSAPDLDGNQVQLSAQIQGKFAVIDFWASWCGPCRKHSMQLIPIYERYKGKGFTVVGIAREQGDGKAMKKAIEQDKYPWTNLLELNDAQRLWERYGIGNAGGSMFLVNPQGIIVALNPSAEEIEDILRKELK